jgi:hypothetical protein
MPAAPRVKQPKPKQNNTRSLKKAAPSKRKGAPKPCSSAELISLFNEVINAGNCTCVHMFRSMFANSVPWNFRVLKENSSTLQKMEVMYN